MRKHFRFFSTKHHFCGNIFNETSFLWNHYFFFCLLGFGRGGGGGGGGAQSGEERSGGGRREVPFKMDEETFPTLS